MGLAQNRETLERTCYNLRDEVKELDGKVNCSSMSFVLRFVLHFVDFNVQLHFSHCRKNLAIFAINIARSKRDRGHGLCISNHMWLMIGHKSDKCDMRVLRVPVTWFLYFCPKIPTPDPCDMRDMRDMRFADL